MKISNPFGLKGHLEINATWIVKPKSGAVALTSAIAGSAKVPIAQTEDPFDLLLNVSVSYQFVNAMSKDWNPLTFGSGEFEHMARWKATLSEDDLELQYVDAPLRGSYKSEGMVKVAMAGFSSTESAAKAKKKFVRLYAVIGALETDEGLTVGYGAVSADILGGDSRGKSIPLEIELDLDVEKAPAKPKVWPKIPRDILKTSAYFGTDSKKGRDSADLPPSSMRDLQDWVRGIEKHEEVFTVLAQGLVEIWLEGNTSKSGSKEYNERLAKQRIAAVERVLTRAFGSSTKLRFVRNPKAQSKFEEQADYRVDVFFHKEQTELVLLGRQS
jgi:outer membrane protein OmpA-like peptidoglycan-associated protein